MDIATVVGLILAFITIGTGMTLKGANLSALINPAALLIILGGTIATICIGFTTRELKKVPHMIKIALTEQETMSHEKLLELLTGLVNISRREGLLSLERRLNDIDDEFLRDGISLAVDGNDSKYIKTILTDEIFAMEDRHRNGALIFTQAGTYAPTLGVLGAVIGLIAALSNLTETDKLGVAISAAFVATLLGIFTGYVLWHPIANKLKQKSKREVQLRLIMLEGILAVQEGCSVLALRQRLNVFLSPSERINVKEEKNEKVQKRTR